MKKFKFLFLAVLIAVMSIGCAQPTEDDTPIIPVSEPEAQPTDIYEAAFCREADRGGIFLYRKFAFQDDCYELQLSEETGSEELFYNAEISGDKLSITSVSNDSGSCNLRLYNKWTLIYGPLAENWHEVVDKCYKKL